MLYVSNAFSLNMLTIDSQVTDLAIFKHTPEEVRNILREQTWMSCVGHVDTAAVFTVELGIDVPMNRVSLKLTRDDALLVGQYVGPRLPEGATQLPEGASIQWMEIGYMS